MYLGRYLGHISVIVFLPEKGGGDLNRVLYCNQNAGASHQGLVREATRTHLLNKFNLKAPTYLILAVKDEYSYGRRYCTASRMDARIRTSTI